jgi:hypothetical protein
VITSEEAAIKEGWHQEEERGKGEGGEWGQICGVGEYISQRHSAFCCAEEKQGKLCSGLILFFALITHSKISDIRNS